MSFCSLPKGITPKIYRFCVCVFINKRSFEPFLCVVLNTTVPEFCDAVVSFQNNPQNSEKWSERRLVFGQGLFPTWIYEVTPREWSERGLVDLSGCLSLNQESHHVTFGNFRRLKALVG